MQPETRPESMPIAEVAFYKPKFLVLGKGGIEALDVVTFLGKFAARGQDPGAGDASGIERQPFSPPWKR